MKLWEGVKCANEIKSRGDEANHNIVCFVRQHISFQREESGEDMSLVSYAFANAKLRS